MIFSNCFETLKLYADAYNKSDMIEKQEEKHIIYVSKLKCILVNAESIRDNFWKYHFYRGNCQSSYQYYTYMNILLPVKLDYGENSYKLAVMNDEIIKSICSNNKKEEILDYIQKSAQITKIIEKHSEKKYSDCMNDDNLNIYFDLSKIIDLNDNYNKNISYVCKIMEKVKKTFRDFYHHNFGFFPIYELLFVSFDHRDMFDHYNHFLAYDHKILDKDQYHYDPSNQKKDYEYTEKIKITTNMIAKEYLQKRNIFASIIDFTACMIKHLNCFVSVVYQQEIIKIFCIIKHILELNNELKFIYIINILLENFHLLINEYHWRIIEQKYGKYEENSLYNGIMKTSVDIFKENLKKIKGVKFSEEPTKILDFIYGNMNNWFCGTAFLTKRDKNGRNQSVFFNNPYTSDHIHISYYSNGSVYKYHGITTSNDSCCIM